MGSTACARVAHTLSFMYAPHEHARYLFFHRVLSMACADFLTVPQGGMSAPPAEESPFLSKLPGLSRPLRKAARLPLSAYPGSPGLAKGARCLLSAVYYPKAPARLEVRSRDALILYA
jgi:hypothetical protein